MHRTLKIIVAVLILVPAIRIISYNQGRKKSFGPAPHLIPASATMVDAWDIPRNPMTGPLPQDEHLSEQIRFGFKLFTDTPHEAPQLSGNNLSCSNCHLNAGQRERALPLVGITGMFPEYNKRAGRLFSMEDRIVECFKRSMASRSQDSTLSPASKEVLAISAYISWLSSGYPVGSKLPWRGQNMIASGKIIPIGKLDPQRGEILYKEKCSNCHGEDGQGVEIGDKKPGPLWGKYSWNDGAGAARVYTLAGMIRYAMPYLDPGSLADKEAQEIAMFIDTQERPAYPFKEKDFLKEKLPPDAVYYRSK
jgi:thiosulfate dehydrogenase